MRKITSLLMLFFAVVSTAFAQITDLNQLSNDKTYFIESARCFLTYSSAHTGNLATSNGTTVPAADKVENPIENVNQQFKILNEGGSYYLYSVGAGKYVNNTGNYVDTPAATDALTITNTGSGSSYPWKILIGGNGMNSQDPNQTEAGVVVNSWTQTDAGNCFKITAIEDITVPITSVEQLDNSKLYSIVPKDATRGVLYATYTSTRLDACGGTRGGASNPTVAVNHKSADQQFALYNHEGNIYLYSVGASKFVGGIVNGRYFELTTTPTHSYTVVESDRAGYFIIKLDNSNYINVSTGWEAGCVGAWATQDDGNQLVISAVADMPESVSTTLYNAFNTQRNFTYTFIYNGVAKATQTCSGNVGEEYPEVDASLLPFGVTATKPDGTIPSDVASNFDLNLTIDLPFEPAADYNSITKWYYLKFHATDRHPLYYPGDESVLLTNKNAVDANNKDAYTWAFIGNPFDGFKVVNFAAGADKALVAAEGGAVVSTGENNVFKFTTSTNATDGFYIQCTTGDYTQRFNRQGGKVVYWSGADAGSTFMVEERDMTGVDELQALIDQVYAIVATGVADGTTVGYITSESATAVATALTAAEAEIANDDKTLETVTAAQAALQAAVDGAQTIQPTVGKFYTIKNAFSNVYMNVSDNGGLITVVDGDTSWGRVFQFVGANNGQFYFMNTERGAYLNTAKSHGHGQELATSNNTTNAIAVTIKNLSKANQVSITPAGGATLHHDANYSTVVAWNGAADSRSAWIIEEVDVEGMAHNVTIGDAGWSSLVLGYNATVPTGVTAYAVSAVDGGYATLASVGDVIPAGQAVLLNTETADEYAFEYAAEAGTITNLLQGTGFNAYIEGAQNTNYYVLSVQEGEVGLYKAMLNKDATGAEGTTHFKNNAFKAYLPLTTTQGVQALRFNFGGETTGVDAVEVVKPNAPIYDLSGRRVLSTVKGGIYIQNGKKFIVK